MALNKKALGTSLLNREKGENTLLSDNEYTLDQFAVVFNSSTNQDMICFTVTEFPDTYFWASTSLHRFLTDNIENAVYDDSTMSYSFPDDEVKIVIRMKK